MGTLPVSSVSQETGSVPIFLCRAFLAAVRDGQFGAAFQDRREVLAREGSGMAGDVLRRAGRKDLSAAAAAFGAEIDDPVGRFDDIEVVLDDDDGIPFIAQPVQDAE